MLNTREDLKSLESVNNIANLLATKIAVEIYEKLVGDSYSADDIKRLIQLKRIYQESLHIPAPVFWDLDERNRPTHRIRNQKWSDYVRQLAMGKQRVGHFYYQSNLIAEYASTYLMERGNRFFGKGRLGDFLEQFIGEWIHFALNDLPTLGFDELSINKVKQRINYIEKVLKHESLFKFGIITRRRNKFDTIESIKQQLQSCIELASKEALRQCAREQFENCCSDTAGLLFACARVIYYARATVVYHEPLELQCFILPVNTFLTAAAKKLYPEIKLTHTGAMLSEVIELAGLESFGTVGAGREKKVIHSIYFNEKYQSKIVDWQSKKMDLPPWVTSEFISEHLINFQMMAESLLRIARLKQLVEEAYDLAGKVGDLWAYGDKQGKLSIDALLFLLEKELDLFKDRFDKLYQYHDQHRHVYNMKYRINPNSGINQNFNKVDEQAVDINKFYASLKKSIKTIRERMTQFPEDAYNRISTKKREFYQSVVDYLKQFYPQFCHQFQPLEQALLEEESIEFNDALLSIIIRPTQPQLNIQQDKSENIQDKNYCVWRNNYIICHQQDYIALQLLVQKFKTTLEDFPSLDQIRAIEKEFEQQIGLLKKHVNEERPAWRFQWAMWPFKTIGLPFNRKKRQYYNYLIHEIDVKSKAFKKFIKCFAVSATHTYVNKVMRDSLKNQKIDTMSKQIENTLSHKKPFLIQGNVNGDEQSLISVDSSQKMVEMRGGFFAQGRTIAHSSYQNGNTASIDIGLGSNP